MMTKEKYMAQRQHLESCIKDIQEQIKTLEVQYSNSSPWKVGDKVRVRDRGRYNPKTSQYEEMDHGELYISQVSLDYSGEYTYKFTKPKKDGSMGNSPAGVYYGSDTKMIRA